MEGLQFIDLTIFRHVNSPQPPNKAIIDAAHLVHLVKASLRTSGVSQEKLRRYGRMPPTHMVSLIVVLLECNCGPLSI